MEGRISRRELEGVASLFISSSDGSQGPSKSPSEAMPSASPEEKGVPEVEEVIRIRKKMAYPATPEGQEALKVALLEFMEKDYRITRIELTKTTDTCVRKEKTIKEEGIIITLKDG
jgi:hypothetical protein